VPTSSSFSSPGYAQPSPVAPTGRAPRTSWQTNCARTSLGPRSSLPSSALGSADGPAGHTLHVERDGSFSITAVVWRSGQVTRIHDHTTWCVFGVIQGAQREDIFDSDLNLIGYADGVVGDVSGFAPPGDIHRVLNPGEETAISLHIYGTDVTRIGSSVRRYYDLPVTT
jgi:3-mercaptopropionate dioxygenase